MLIGYVGPSGGTIYSTVKRLSDNYYLESGTVFTSAPTFANKRLTMTEGTSENRGFYSINVTSTFWNDGLYEVKVHDGNNSNIVLGGQESAMMNGVETTLGNEVPIYHCDINFVKDTNNSDDEYLVTFFKNGAIITGGVTSPVITVKDKSGTNLIAAATLTQVSGGIYKYVATTTQRQTNGEMYNALVGATDGSNTISFSWNLGRDAS